MKYQLEDGARDGSREYFTSNRFVPRKRTYLTMSPSNLDNPPLQNESKILTCIIDETEKGKGVGGEREKGIIYSKLIYIHTYGFGTTLLNYGCTK